jgi:hypothetical protein
VVALLATAVEATRGDRGASPNPPPAPAAPAGHAISAEPPAIYGAAASPRPVPAFQARGGRRGRPQMLGVSDPGGGLFLGEEARIPSRSISSSLPISHPSKMLLVATNTAFLIIKEDTSQFLIKRACAGLYQQHAASFL